MAELGPTERAWRVREMSQRLQTAASRMGSLDASEAATLARHAAAVLGRWPIVPAPSAAAAAFPPAAAGRRPPRERLSWSCTNKAPQVAWMLEQVVPFVEEARRRHRRGGGGGGGGGGGRGGRPWPLRVVDIGGGKGTLAAAIAERFGPAEVSVRVVDVMAAAVFKGRARARRLGTANIGFFHGDASRSDLEGLFADGCDGDGVDLVVALHACGALSDVALAQAVNSGAGFVVAPCCYKANGSLRVPVCGPCAPAANPEEERAAPSAWLGLGASEHGGLLKAAELQGDAATAALASRTVAALRAEAAQRHWRQRWGDTGGGIDVFIREFPLAYSARNLCLVGVPQWKPDGAL